MHTGDTVEDLSANPSAETLDKLQSDPQIQASELSYINTADLSKITENVKLSPVFFPESPSLAVVARDTDEYMINSLTMGVIMTKIPNKSSSRPKDRFIKVDLEPPRISFDSKNGTKGRFK
jgi:hypothetical protein